MSGKRVLIVSSNGLFREGLKHILAGTADFALTKQTTSLQEAEDLARAREVDVVIIDQADEETGHKSSAEVITRLISVPCVRVITVGLDSGDLRVYKQECVEGASVEDLVAALDS